MRGLARIYDVRMAQFVLKIEKLSHIMGPRASQDLRSPSLIMAPVINYYLLIYNNNNNNYYYYNNDNDDDDDAPANSVGGTVT